jgi:primosomal protein N''
MPSLDPASLVRKLQAKIPALTTVCSLSLVKWQLQRQFHKQIFSDLGDFLDVYTKQLRSWLRESVEESCVHSRDEPSFLAGLKGIEAISFSLDDATISQGTCAKL